MDEDFQTLLTVFRAEIGEVLDDLLQSIEMLHLLRGEELQNQVAGCMRLAHNVKGGAAIVANEEIESLAHTLEDVLNLSRSAEQPPSQEVLELMLEDVMMMQRLIDDEGSPAAVAALVRRLAKLCELPAGEAAAAGDGEHEGDEHAGARQEDGDASVPSEQAADADTAQQHPQPALPSASRPAANVRVETARLDRIMGHIGELLIARARLSARVEGLVQLQKDFLATVRARPVDEQQAWLDLAARLEAMVQQDRHEMLGFTHLTSDLAAAMKAVRMIPLALSGAAWRRTVRQSADSLGKKVRLSMQVGEIELDRLVLERLREPIVHLLRNAVDHGIEPPEERKAQGKPSQGAIRIRAAMQGAMVRLGIGDDGRGIVPRQIGEMAVAKGLCSQQELAVASDEELLEYLFTPGFSSADRVSKISGRGVGLDVVQRALDGLGGSIEVRPQGSLGGATFVLSLPVSLLSSKGLLVQAGGATYALPIEHVEHTLRVAAESVEQVDGAQAIRTAEDEPVRLRWLSSLMGGEQGAGARKLKVVVISRGATRLGLVVDDVLKEEEYVTKHLPWNLKQVPGVNGAVILADGSLAVAVDVAQLFEAEWSELDRPPAGQHAGTPKPTVLVADDSVISRTLEYNTLAAAGYDVVLVVDGAQAWQELQRQHFDVLVSDVQMPGLDGIELTRRVRSDPRLHDLPVVLVTGLGDTADIARGATAGANEYVVKGRQEQEKLLEAVARLL